MSGSEHFGELRRSISEDYKNISHMLDRSEIAPAKAVNYREKVRQLREMAAAPDGPVRNQLANLAHQFDILAADAERLADPPLASKKDARHTGDSGRARGNGGGSTRPPPAS